MSVEAVLLVLSKLYVHQVVQVKKIHVSFKFRRKDGASLTTKVPVTEVGDATEKALLEYAYGISQWILDNKTGGQIKNTFQVIR